MTDEKKRHYHKKWEDFSIGVKVLIIIGGIIAGTGLLILCGFVVMWLWNALMPKIFGLPTIGFWEAWGLFILAHILFGRMGGSGNNRSERGRKRKLRDKIRDLEDFECSEKERAHANEGSAPTE